MKIADLFVDLKLDVGSFGTDLNKAINTAESKASIDVPVKAVTKNLSKDLNAAVAKATPKAVEIPVKMDEAATGRAVEAIDTLGGRAGIAAGGIGDLAGALEANGVIGEKTAAIMETTAASIQGIAGVADLALVSTELLKAAKLRDAAASVRQTAANVTHAAASKVVTAATYVQATATRVLNAALRANPIGIVITAITGLIAVLVLVYKKNEAFRNIVNSAWATIKSAIVGAWNNYIKPAFTAMWRFITNTLVPTIKNLYNNVVKPIFARLGDTISFVWNNVVKPIFAAYKFYIMNILVPVIKFLYNNVVKPIFTALGNTIKFVWDKVIKPTFDAIKTGVGLVRAGFKTAVDAIGKIWSGLKAAAAKPVNFVIDTIYNNGLRKALNYIPGVDLAKAPTIPGYAGGGVLPGYSPGRDIHRFYSPTGGGLALSGGEAIMRPEWARAVGGAKGVGKINKLARSGAFDRFAGGGLFRPANGVVTQGHHGSPTAIDIGVPVGSPVYAGHSGTVTVSRDLTGYEPRNHIQNGYRSYGRYMEIAGSGISTLYAHLSRRSLSAGTSVLGGKPIGLSGNTGHSTGPHLHFGARGIDPFSFMSGSRGSGLPGGGVASSGSSDGGGHWWDNLGKIKDAIKTVKSGLAAMGNSGWFGMMKSAAKSIGNKVIDWVNDKIPNASAFGIGIPDNPIPRFDRGGWLKQGRTLAVNATGKPEAVLTSNQWSQMERLISAVESGKAGGSPLIGHAVIRENVDLERYERQRAFRERRTWV